MRLIALRSIVIGAVCLVAMAPIAHAVSSSKAPKSAAPKSVTMKSAAPKSAAPKSAAVKARSAVPRNAPVELCAINGKETLFLRLRDDKGRPLRGVQKRFDHLLRCHHTNVEHAMNPRLVRILYQVGKHYPGLRVEIVSGYRHPSVAKNPRSPHMQGLACDFRIAGVKNQALRDYLRRNFDKVGVGYYPNSSFVHLDVRKDRSAFWIDYSGPGGRAMYSDNPIADLKTGRADTYRPTTIDKDWVEGAEQTGPTTKVPTGGAEARVGQGPVQVEEGGDDDGPPATQSPGAPGALPAAPRERVSSGVNVSGSPSVARE